MTIDRNLALAEITLRPSGEWIPPRSGWLMARVQEGAGYWLQNNHAWELSPGDCFVMATTGRGSLRVSQMGPLVLQYYYVDPRAVADLLTVAEGKHLDECFEDPDSSMLLYPASHEVAREFGAVVQSPRGAGLLQRCRYLLLWAGATGCLLKGKRAEAIESVELRERLKRMISQITEAELTGCTLEDLVKRMGCSERHFSRLFRQEFGVSFRKRQIELRLLRARRLLANPHSKIIHVAYDSGYRHLGLFNSMFKKRFGITPSQWRRAAQKNATQATRSGPKQAWTLLLFAGALAISAARSFAGDGSHELQLGTPISKEQMNQVEKAMHQEMKESSAAQRRKETHRPEGATTNGPSFEVKGYDLIGNTILPNAVAEAVMEPYTGTAMTFDDVRQAMADLRVAYHQRGFVTVNVSLPPQKLTNGIVKIQVIEGQLAEINVVGNRYFSSNNIMRSLPGLHTNMLLNSHMLQRELDAANASRDRQIYPRIGPGPDPGTSTLELRVKDRLPLHARLDWNNENTPGTPDYRINFNAQYNNLWDLDHQIGIQYGFTPQQFKSGDEFHSTFLDDPLVANYSGYYRIPLASRESAQQALASTTTGSFGYNEASHRFVMPPASGQPDLTVYASRSTVDTGVQFGPVELVSTNNPLVTIAKQDSGQNLTLSEGLGGRLSIPTLTSDGAWQTTFSVGLDWKRYRQISFNTNNFYETVTFTNSNGGQTNINTVVSSPQPPHETGVDYLPINLGIDLLHPDEWGNTEFNFTLNWNPFTGLSGDNAFSQTGPSPNTRADYATMQAGLNRDQKLGGDWLLVFRSNAQIANGSLISNEQFPIGGVASVRGYHEGELYGDSGWRVSIEPHTPFWNLGLLARSINAAANGETLPADTKGHDLSSGLWLRASAFVDYGEVYVRDPMLELAHHRLLGVGFGMTANIWDHFDARLVFGWPLLTTATTHAGDLRINFGLGMQF